jgi:iron complex transport system ATP-binding protein
LPARRRFLETLSGIAGAGKTIILVTHHVEEVLPEIRRTVLLSKGKVFQDGSTDAVLTSVHLSALFGEPIEVRRQNGAYSAGVQG